MVNFCERFHWTFEEYKQTSVNDLINASYILNMNAGLANKQLQDSKPTKVSTQSKADFIREAQKKANNDNMVR